MRTIEDFLKNRGVSQSVIDKLADEKIDYDAVIAMTDQDMAAYFPAYGDRVALMSFARCVKREQQSTTSSESTSCASLSSEMILGLKRKLGKTNKNAMRKTRRVEMGWLNFNKSSSLYKQVRSINGGGTRSLSIERSLTVELVKDAALKTFFPEGKSKLGNVNNFIIEIRDFKGDTVDLTRTIEDLYNGSKLKMLRLYLYTIPITQSDAQTTTLAGVQPTGPTPLPAEEQRAPLFADVQPAPSFAETQREPLCPDVQPTTSTAEQHPAPQSANPQATQSTIDSDATFNWVDSGTPEIAFHPRHTGNRLSRSHPAGSSTTSSWRARLHEATIVDSSSDGDDGDLQRAIEASIIETDDLQQSTMSTEAVLQMWVASTLVSCDFADEQEILIHRRRILESTQRAISRNGFQLQRSFRVQFPGEEAEDYGGPRREFLCNLLKEVSQSMFEGADGHKTCIHSLTKLDKDMFKFAGKVVVWSLLHGGPAFPIFSPSFVRLMMGENAAELSLNDVNDADVKELIEKVNDAPEAEILSMSDWLIDAGLGPVQIPLTLDMRKQMTQQLIKNHVFLRVHAEIAQFMEGLDSLGGFHKLMKRHPQALLPLFSPSSEKLTSTKLRSLYTANFKEVGHNDRQDEEDTMYSFECFLQECDGESFPVSVTDVLAFWTGSEEVPPLGFHKRLEVDFVPNNTMVNRLPVAHTCNLSLELPRGVKEPDGMIRVMPLDGVGNFIWHRFRSSIFF